MPLISTARRNEITETSLSLYRARRTMPSPVTARHRQSDSHGSTRDTLSMATTRDAAAATAQDSTSRGAVRSGESDGSASCTSSPGLP